MDRVGKGCGEVEGKEVDEVRDEAEGGIDSGVVIGGGVGVVRVWKWEGADREEEGFMCDGVDGVDLREVFANALDLASDFFVVLGYKGVAFFQLGLRSAEIFSSFSLSLGALLHSLTSSLETGLEFATSCRRCSELLSLCDYGALDGCERFFRLACFVDCI